MFDLEQVYRIRNGINEQLKQLINQKLASKFWTYDLSTDLAWKLRVFLNRKFRDLDSKTIDAEISKLGTEYWRIDPFKGSTNRSINDFILVNGEVRPIMASSIFMVFRQNEVHENTFALTLVGTEEGSILGFISAERESIALDALNKLLKNASDQH